MRVYEALARKLRESGTDVFFGLVGDDTVKLSSVLASLGSQYYGARHECQAVSMADGYARASGRAGVAIVSRGPGFTNALTAMVCAAKARSRVLIIAGDTAVGLHDAGLAVADRLFLKHVDQNAICAGAGVIPTRILSPDSAVADLEMIMARVRVGYTVSLNVPIDVLNAEAGNSGATVILPPLDLDPLPDPSLMVTAVADLIETGWAAQRVIILAGRGAVQARARSELEALAVATSALLATSLGGHGLFAGNSYNLGICGTLSSPVASEFIRQADLVLVFGATLNPFTTYRDSIFPKARIVQVDSDPAAFGRHMRQPDVAIHADARVLAQSLVEELKRRNFSPTIGFRAGDAALRLSSFDPRDFFSDQSTSTTLDPRTLMLELAKILPADRCLVVEGGSHADFAVAYLGVRDPAEFIYPIESASIGLGIGVAIGASVGTPKGVTVLEIGDGGIMMTLGDLETAIRYRSPMIIIITNNESLGAEVNILAEAGLPTDVARFSAPSFAELATVMGGEGHTVRSVSDLLSLRERLAGPIVAPVVLDCHVNPAVLAPTASWYAPALTQVRDPNS